MGSLVFCLVLEKSLDLDIHILVKKLVRLDIFDSSWRRFMVESLRMRFGGYL